MSALTTESPWIPQETTWPRPPIRSIIISVFCIIAAMAFAFIWLAMDAVVNGIYAYQVSLGVDMSNPGLTLVRAIVQYSPGIVMFGLLYYAWVQGHEPGIYGGV